MVYVRWTLLISTLLLSGMKTSLASSVLHTPSGLDRDIVEINVTSFVDGMPEKGFVDLEVEVRNRMSREGRWNFHFQASERWDDSSVLQHTRSLTVPGAAVRTVVFRVPVFPAMVSTYSQNPRLSLRVTGPGTTGQKQDILHSGSKHSPESTRIVFRSDGGTLPDRPQPWGGRELETILQKDSRPVRILDVDGTRLPVDVQSYFGADILVMSEQEWGALPPPQRSAILQWVAQGGHAIRVGRKAQRAEQIGLGTTRVISEPSAAISDVGKILSGLSSPALQGLDTEPFSERSWRFRKEIPEVSRPIALLFITVILVAGVLGPLNLMIAYRRRDSLQILWVTPLLSLGITVLIGMFILLGDGLGGKGIRAQRVLLLPEQNLEITHQEQLSKTGVVFRSGFQLAEEWWMRPVALNRSQVNRPSRYDLQPGGWHGGDWFRNRNLQAHLLQRIRVSRAEVSIRWREGVPVVVSTFDAPFEQLYFRDDAGGTWQAGPVAPGQETALTPHAPAAFQRALSGMSLREKSLFPGERALQEKGWFYAAALPGDRMAETLNSVSWRDETLWVFGPVVEDQP